MAVDAVAWRLAVATVMNSSLVDEWWSHNTTSQFPPPVMPVATSEPVSERTGPMSIENVSKEIGSDGQWNMWRRRHPDKVTHRQLVPPNHIWRQSTTSTHCRRGYHQLDDDIRIRQQWVTAKINNLSSFIDNLQIKRKEVAVIALYSVINLNKFCDNVAWDFWVGYSISKCAMQYRGTIAKNGTIKKGPD